jgi:hypothetical protein
LSIRLNSEDEHCTCYLKPKEGPMRVHEPNGNPRTHIQNVVTDYTYASGREDDVRKKGKKEKKTPKNENGDEEE